MNRCSTGVGLFAWCLFATALTGCGDDKGKAVVVPPAGPPAHAHADHGPHDGDLIELGNEEYHAEMVHDDKAGTLTIYILDGTAKKAVPIAATEITINVKHDGKPEQFKLAASAQTGEPAGQASRFVSSDKALGEHLDHAADEKELVLDIAGKQYHAPVKHDHAADHK